MEGKSKYASERKYSVIRKCQLIAAVNTRDIARSTEEAGSGKDPPPNLGKRALGYLLVDVMQGFGNCA